MCVHVQENVLFYIGQYVHVWYVFGYIYREYMPVWYVSCMCVLMFRFHTKAKVCIHIAHIEYIHMFHM